MTNSRIPLRIRKIDRGSRIQPVFAGQIFGNPFRFVTNVLVVTQGSALARNPGLQFVNAYGVTGDDNDNSSCNLIPPL
jgi:hypothetical protein